MLYRKLCKPIPQLLTRNLHNNFPNRKKINDQSSFDCVNFIISFTNCIIVSSILWGFESYKEKVKLIEETNVKIGELVVAYRLLERKCTKSEYPLSD